MIAYLLTLLVILIVSLVFYIHLFGSEGAEPSLWLPIVVVLAPSALFVFGLSMLLGRVNGHLIFALIPVVFITGAMGLPLPAAVDLFSNGLITKLTTDAYEGAANSFALPTAWLVGRIGFTMTGLHIHWVCLLFLRG
ncbi:hypothetical protein D3C78_1451020 [compost metagenome]